MIVFSHIRLISILGSNLEFGHEGNAKGKSIREMTQNVQSLGLNPYFV
jgi:hypothetical protein